MGISNRGRRSDPDYHVHEGHQVRVDAEHRQPPIRDVGTKLHSLVDSSMFKDQSALDVYCKRPNLLYIIYVEAPNYNNGTMAQRNRSMWEGR